LIIYPPPRFDRWDPLFVSSVAAIIGVAMLVVIYFSR
jgi:hypothetical protein